MAGQNLKFIHWLFAPIRLENQLGHEVRLALGRTYLEYSRLNVAMNSVAALALALLVWRSVPLWLVGGWLVMMFSFFASGAVRLWRKRQKELRLPSADRLLSRAGLWTSLIGFGWGSTVAFLPWLDPLHRINMLLILTGLCIGAAVTLSSTPKAAKLFLFFCISPFLVHFALKLDVNHLVLCLLTIGLVLCLQRATDISHRTLIASVDANRSALQARQELMDAYGHWAELSETAEAFALFGKRRELLLWNDAYLRLLGLEGHAVSPGMDWETLAARVDETTVLARLPEHSLLGKADLEERTGLLVREVEIRDRWYRSTVRALSNGHTAISHVDISALKYRESELMDLHRELQEAMASAESGSRAKSRFLANISHELRTPLNAIIGFSDLMVQDNLRGRDGTTRHPQYARTILDSGHHLLSLVEDMLDLARIEVGKLRLYTGSTDIIELVESAAQIALGREAAAASEEILDLHLPEGPCFAVVDAKLLRQALINVISNAVKFSRKGQRVTVTLAEQGDRTLSIEVLDQGIGIPENMTDRVFEPFAQVEDSETRNFGGVGLGLPLARQFMELHGGSISLTSRIGEGTRVTLTLPRGVQAKDTGNIPARAVNQ